ncbi:hypothetical protein HaLaN_28701 [Haematococcus lacustris]|uniref:Uncharacterized protein n=1 Tax=Haematococcus lacustris TaxID=44745 RepID=A0A6A0AB79_HAELA|nr:hypothetical protein HaLaN_28701 [Haematococcus lacustris]
MHADAAKPSEKASEGSVTEPSIQFGTLNTGAVQENKPPAKDKSGPVPGVVKDT